MLTLDDADALLAEMIAAGYRSPYGSLALLVGEQPVGWNWLSLANSRFDGPVRLMQAVRQTEFRQAKIETIF